MHKTQGTMDQRVEGLCQSDSITQVQVFGKVWIKNLFSGPRLFCKSWFCSRVPVSSHTPKTALELGKVEKSSLLMDYVHIGGRREFKSPLGSRRKTEILRSDKG